MLGSVHYKERKLKAESVRLYNLPASDQEIYERNKKMIVDNLADLIRLYGKILDSVKKYDSGALDKAFRKLTDLEAYGFIKHLETADPKPAQILLYSTDLLQDIASSALIMGEECMHYIQNLHKQPGCFGCWCW